MAGKETGGIFFHFIQRMFERSVTLGEVLETLSKGKLYFDPKFNSYVRLLVTEGGKRVWWC